MLARDVMTTPVLSISSKAKIGEAIALLLKSRLSGLPVVDERHRLVGILSEGDLLRRAELGTERRRPRWIEAFLMPGHSASDYVRTHGRVIEEVMTREPITATETTPLTEIVSLMERNRIKRVPVLRDGVIAGIITRADLLRVLASRAHMREPGSPDDQRIRDAIEANLKSQSWAPGSSVRIEVKDGVVELSGIILNDRFRDAIRVCAENTQGVKAVRDNLVFVEPFTGAYVDPKEMKG